MEGIYIFIFFIVGFVFAALMIFLARVLEPRMRGNPQYISPKQDEASEEIFLSYFDHKFHTIVLVFITFEIVIMFLLLWGITLKEAGFISFISMAMFLAVQIAGLLYLWARNDFEWK